MFFIIFIHLFSQSFPINAISCMTNEGNSLLNVFDINKCAFELNIGEAMHDNNQIEGLPNCKTRSADTLALQGSCYGEVAIDYKTKKMSFRFAHVTLADSFSSPYDDMLGTFKTAESLVQYKISGNMEENSFVMVTRVQCKIQDNCALDQIRAMLPNVTIVEPRVIIFKEIGDFLNQRNGNVSDPLTCVTESGAEEDCPSGNDRCEFRIKDNGQGNEAQIDTHCTTAEQGKPIDIEYRINVLSKTVHFNPDDDLEKPYKCNYICRTDLCNSKMNFAQADHLLFALAMGSQAQASIPAKPDPIKPYSRKRSASQSLSMSFYEQIGILCIVFIQFLAN